LVPEAIPAERLGAHGLPHMHTSEFAVVDCVAPTPFTILCGP